MSLWDRYKVSTLPEEQRAEVIKAIAHEQEETVRTRLNSPNHQTVRGLFIGFLALLLIPAGLIGYNWVDSWKEVRLKSMTPMVCPAAPPPPPCPAASVQAFDIKVVPVTAAPAVSK